VKSRVIEIGPGELVDRLGILRIKERHTEDPEQRARIQRMILRLADLQADLRSPDLDGVMAKLQEVNARLWAIEDELRACERRQDFGPHFVQLARQVYKHNDERARLKRAIDEHAGWSGAEDKIYAQPRSDGLGPGRTTEATPKNTVG
jgi:hypothetical protein